MGDAELFSKQKDGALTEPIGSFTILVVNPEGDRAVGEFMIYQVAWFGEIYFGGEVVVAEARVNQKLCL